MTEHTYSTTRFLSDIRGLIRPHRMRFWVASTLRAVGDIVWLYPAFALATVVDFLADYEVGESLVPVWMVMALSAGAVVVRYGAMVVAKRMMFSVSEKMALDIKLQATAHVLQVPMSWHEKESTGSKLKKIDRGGDSVDRVLRVWVNNIIQIIVNLVGITIILTTFDVWVALVTVFFLATFFLLARFFIVRAGRASDVVNQGEEDMSGLLFETTNSIRTVQVMGMGSALMDRLKKSADMLYKNIRTRIFWFQTGMSSRGFYGQTFRIAVLCYIIVGVAQGTHELGFLILFNSYFSDVWSSMQELSNSAQELVVAKFSIGRLMRLFDVPLHTRSEEKTGALHSNWKELKVAHLSFSYGQTDVLKDVSFTVRRGERVGIVGLSGAGKSTLFKILLKEHEVPSTSVMLDATPFSRIKREDWLDHTAVVLQDTEVFNFTLRENIVMASIASEHDEGLLTHALDVSHVSDFVRTLPEGVDTLIGEKGVRLSGGERQRLGIARAVFKKPQLLLLDEATSNLDLESEEKIRQSLHEFFQNVTALVIAHRLTTVKEMDRILVMHNGRIEEEGTFEELYARKGRFYTLWEKQKL